jgi:putative transcriptional regulator
MGTIVYNKLLAMMEEKGLSTYKIRKEKIISEGTLQNIRNGKSITLDSVASLCNALNCQPGDILDYIPDTDLKTQNN